MKVVLLANGASVHTVRWANSLSEDGLDVVLLTQDGAAADISPRVRIVHLPHKGQLGYFRNAAASRRLLKAERPDLVNAHYASGYGTTARLCGYRPTLLSVWGSDVFRFPYRSIAHRLLVQGNLMAASRIASTSHAMAAQTRRLAPRLGPIAVTPFGVDMSQFQPRASPRADDEVVIGTVKALRHVYGVDLLVRAFGAARHALSTRRPDLANRLRLRIVGDGPEGGALSELVAGLGLSDVASFTPHVPHDEVPVRLHELDIYVALSRMESFGVAVIEASACGLPVVVSDVGGLPEVVADGKTGLVVPLENVDAAAEALVRLVTQPDLRRRMGQAGRRRIEELYDWNVNVVAMKRLYEEVARGSDSSPVTVPLVERRSA